MPSYVVTGASRGIGLEFVRQLSASPENTVFALVRNVSTALTVPSSPLKNDLANVHVLEADVTDHKALKAAAAKVAEVTGGSLDVLINNAAAINGDNDWRTLLDFEGEEELLEEEFNRSIKVNVLGVIHSTHSFLPLLRKGATRKVATISSVGGDCDFVLETGLAQAPAYGASKAAVNMVIAKYSAKLQNEGFTMVALSPGMVDTSATAGGKVPKNSEWVVGYLENLKIVKPNSVGIIKPEVSVIKLLEIIARCTPKDNGRYIQE